MVWLIVLVAVAAVGFLVYSISTGCELGPTLGLIVIVGGVTLATGWAIIDSEAGRGRCREAGGVPVMTGKASWGLWQAGRRVDRHPLN